MKTPAFLIVLLLLLGAAAQAQTTRTWVGTTNDWGTASNWSPSGVPSSSDTAKITGTGVAPVLGANRSIGGLYVNSDSLIIGGYTLTVAGTVSVINSVVRDTLSLGKIAQEAGGGFLTKYVNSKVNCKVVGESGRIIATSSVFADSTRFSRIAGTVKSDCGGNVFHGRVEIENSDNYAFNFGVDLPDTFWNTVTVRNFSTTRLGLCRSSTGNYFAAGMTLLNLSTHANSSVALFTTNTTFSTATCAGTLFLGATGGLEIKTVGNGGQLTMAAGSIIKIDPMGFAAGTLILANVQQQNTSAISFTGVAAGSEVRINMGTTLRGEVSGTGFRTFNVYDASLLGGVDVSAEQTVIKNTYFGSDVNLTRTSTNAPVSLYMGGNYFAGNFTFTHQSGAAESFLGHSAADIVMGHLKISNSSTNRIMFGKEYHSLVHGNVKLLADSGQIFMGNNAGSVTLCGTGNQVWTSYRNTTLSNIGLQSIMNIRINKPSGRVLLNGPMDVRKALSLTSGIVEVKDTTDYVKLRTGGTLTGASNASYVEGSFIKEGVSAFTFPVGANGHYRPIGISAPADTAEFRARYYNVNSDDYYPHSQRDSTIGGISRNEGLDLQLYFGQIDKTLSCCFPGL